MEIVFATHNKHKIKEVQLLLPSNIKLVSLEDIGCKEDIEETGHTLEENALIKANYIKKNYNLPCFADDSGLLVTSLNNAPGVYSARYAGPQKNDLDNINKLLQNLLTIKDRSASFKTVIAFVNNETTIIFNGTIEGNITTKVCGNNGFGYDPIFKPKGYNYTFAELPLSIKNKIGHRGKAISKLNQYLSQELIND